MSSGIDTNIALVVIEAHRRGFTVQSDFARHNAHYVAMCASMGLISTRLFGNVYGRQWLPTVEGLTLLKAVDVATIDED